MNLFGMVTGVTEQETTTKLDAITIAIYAIGVLIALVGIYALIQSLILMIKYIKFNRKDNSCGLKGKEIARKILDHFGLNKIRVKYNGSLLFGNSYSHYFKKVRLRRISFNKKSVSALAMASQKSCLALLDKENDPDMKKRIRLTPIIIFGPFMFVPLIVIGVLIDLFIIQSESLPATLCCLVLSVLLYVWSFVLAIKVLKTEKKAQAKALQVCRELNLANAEEIEDMKELFELYNKQYILDIIIAFLEMIRFILQLLQVFKGTSTNNSNN